MNKNTQSHTDLFAEVRQNLREISESQKRSQKNTEQYRIEAEQRRKEYEQYRIKAEQYRIEAEQRRKELELQMKETDRQLKKAEGLFTTQWGKLMETLVEGDLLKLMKQKNIRVDDTTMNMKGCYKDQNWEVDILASNGEEIVLVEVKTTLNLQDVKDFIYKLKKFTTWKPKYKNDKMYGAVAYLKADQGSARYAEKQGLFVIRATGSSSSIVNKKDFQPKIFS